MRRWLSLLCLVTGVLLILSQTGIEARESQAAPDLRRLEVTIHDEQGLPIVGARIDIEEHSRGIRRSAFSAAQPLRITNLPPGLYEMRVEATGFASESKSVDLRNEPSAVIEVRLQAGGLRQEVVVTPSRTEQALGDTPASISIITNEEIKASPAVVADDVLRRIPTFSLFRRTSSLSSHPTAQGVSLRGIGPSGVSRTLVLIDNVPFNDPFGGWVYWTRVPLESIDRVEVVEGPSSSLYGNYAMGGVINFVSRRPVHRSLELKSQYGNRDSPKLDFSLGDLWGKLGIAVDGSYFKTGGFPIVPPFERGIVDTKATVAFQNTNLKLDYGASSSASAFLRAGYFHEARNNGKASTFDGTEEANDTIWRSLNGGIRLVLPDESDLQARVFADSEDFGSSYLAVPAANPPRSIGRMSLLQLVPTRSVGGMVQWSRALGRRHYLTAGTDWRWIQGDSREDVLDSTTGQTVILKRISGGTQRSLGVFIQDLLSPLPRLQFSLAVRIDHWDNYDAHNHEIIVATGMPGQGNNPQLPGRSDTVASPRVAVLYHLTEWCNLWAGANWGFRAPTLNELYRQFRVGTVLTLANYELGPERLAAAEAGINVALRRGLAWRTTWFDNRVKDAVANVTIAASPGLTTQQRQNLGRTRIWGLQSDVEYRLGSSWRLGAGYLFNQAKIREFAANPSIVGNFLPQVPEHRGSANVAYSNPKWVDLALGVQWVGRQFDDDMNARVVPGYSEPGLPRYAVVYLNASRSINQNLVVFLGVQNMFDQQYYVGTLPTTVGSPRFVSGGLRFHWPSR
jgi:outer membrane receptor protein involved in Fe transport